MKFSCHKDTILKEVEYAINFTSQKNSISISSNILLENYNDSLTIKSTDNKLGFKVSFPVQTITPGSTTVTCDKFLAILKSLPSVDFIFDEEKDNMTIYPSNEKSTIKFNIRVISAERFPELLAAEDQDFFSLSQRDFFDMFDKVSFSVSADPNFFFLTGVYMEKKDGKVVFVTTDSKRLSFVERVFEQDVPDFPSAIIPLKFLSLLKTIGSGEGLFNIALTPTTIFAEINGHFIYSSLINGDFPPYQRILPKSLTYECKIKREDIMQAITRVSLLVESKDNRIYFDLGQDGLLISGENSEYGNAKEIIQCEYNGPDVKLSFNYSFIITPIKKMDGDYCSICYNSNKEAIKLLPEPERDYFYIIMPMNIT